MLNLTQYHFTSLLVDDDFVKVVRVGAIYREMESGNEESYVTDLNEEYTSQILSGVRFAPLQVRPAVTTVIPSNVWSPSMQRGYQSDFKRASRQLLLCSNSQLVQPLPVLRQEERLNSAAMLPKTIWLEILSYTHRKCELLHYLAFARIITTTRLTLLMVLDAARVRARTKRD